ncbi:MAG TPA: GAF domain-containing protein [Candidatus Kapabacteria bacterium]|nr:GAF domain-containing protein [Candidatus Kapabacteria bacterium]
MSTWHQSDLSQLAPEAQWLERAKELEALISVDEPAVTALANAAAFIWASLDRINWAGFYLFDGEKLVLGPFMGKPACTVIAMGKGVCGTAAEKRETIIVDDVHAFPGHIACDDASQSEIVVPLIAEGRLIGVLDIDAPVKARFDTVTAQGLRSLAEVVSEKLSSILKIEGRFRV